jgi:hypothetical protein
MKVNFIHQGIIAVSIACLISIAGAGQKPVNMAAVFGIHQRFEVFVGVARNNGGVYQNWQTAPGGPWNGAWRKFLPAPDDNPNGIVAGKDDIGRMVVAWISNGKIFHADALNTDASLTAASSPLIPSVEGGTTYPYIQLTMITDAQGMINILALTKRGRVISFREDNQNPGQPFVWAGPQVVGGGDVRNISVALVNNVLAIAGTGADGKVYVKTQTSTGAWPNNDNWTPLGGNKIQSAYVQASSARQIEVVALGADRSLYLDFQDTGTNVFSGWRKIVDATAHGKLAPAIFFGRFQDGSLFVTAHSGADDPEFVGSFGKTFQQPGNGGWSGLFFYYNATTVDQRGSDSQDDLRYLSPAAFAMAGDAKGIIHYFSCYRANSSVEHYVDYSGPSAQRALGFQDRQHTIPNLPWSTNQQ